MTEKIVVDNPVASPRMMPMRRLFYPSLPPSGGRGSKEPQGGFVKPPDININIYVHVRF